MPYSTRQLSALRLGLGDHDAVTTASAELLPTHRRRGPHRSLVMGGLVVLLVVTALVYYRVGWARMESTWGRCRCAANQASWPWLLAPA